MAPALSVANMASGSVLLEMDDAELKAEVLGFAMAPQVPLDRALMVLNSRKPVEQAHSGKQDRRCGLGVRGL